MFRYAYLIESQLNNRRIFITLIVDENIVIKFLPEMKNVLLIYEIDISTRVTEFA